MEKWARINYMPCLPLGDNNSKITGSKKHIELSKQAAAEGMVLLKNNNNTLPLSPNSKAAIFGKAQIDYVKGGGGSGVVHSAYCKNIYDSLKSKINVFDPLSLYYEGYVNKMYTEGNKSGLFDEPDFPAGLLNDALNYTDTAIIAINRYSGEGWDRKNDGTDTYFDLTDKEREMVTMVCANFSKVIVLINAGAMISTDWFANNDKIQSAVMVWQGGMEGAQAVADMLTGEICPSGKLVDTCAKSFFDYPSSQGFHESEDYVKYHEDIFVGYRYFETIPDMADKVVYPFGYGLSYTDFEISNISAVESENRIYVSAKVTNIGKYSGKEVIQLYFSAPEGKITKSKIELCAFRKTKLLNPSQSEILMLDFEVNSMASYDDMGDVCESAYVMEQGEYKLYIGNSVRNIRELSYKHTEPQTRVVKQLTKYCSPQNLASRLTANGEYIDACDDVRERKAFPTEYICKKEIQDTDSEPKMLIDVYNGAISLDDFLARLSDDELISLVGAIPSQGVANTGGIGGISKYKIPAPMTADGPAGVRIAPQTGVYTTAFPIATMLACTWNTKLVKSIGKAGALEMKENNLYIWLTPALNIHRSPLCGRNFEYYSEDPYISGEMAAAMVSGIQSEGIVATPKHFACNNKETNRFESNSIVSERALREIYLKAFEICVRKSHPKAIMTAYNIINGVRASENAELIDGILRNEWGFDGLVMTDWWNHASHCKEILAGNDIRMPYNAKTDLKDAFENGKIGRNEIAKSAKRVLELILNLE